ncbi:MerR family transcriptional regulator [Lactobacillus helveticus]|uniref:HTH-type transcriptional regulator AdhR n=3 Tax=Lactobacillus helveticus TaxID=1587 RepID=A0A2I6BM63_LACHE|nr:MerR family transcriptional regulator [Lactobacillus helveticus]ABX27238.1 MerR transcriptional regulator [Lactobacillus helveticus DPC 4571]AUI76174.1 MerR family transcriptional regulator [Lactobacillus helveticus]MDY0990803.1 MerR family transcriptional regulator [Lactobacillus helveticus]MDY1001513.1 MerR family transcriptional regulator [Lactobacillus helveticus]MEB2873354.1 MerR family transcriptional regulator [Lactobacillus helveticus]
MTDLTITDVSEKYYLKLDTLRYYERIGLIPAVLRKKNGNRYYNEGLQKWIEMIVCLRHSGITVEALVDYVKLIEQCDSTLQAREDLLKEQLALLETKKKNLNRSIKRLEHKISLYESGEIKQ